MIGVTTCTDDTNRLVADALRFQVGLGNLFRLDDFIIDLVPNTTDIATVLITLERPNEPVRVQSTPQRAVYSPKVDPFLSDLR